MRSEIGGANQRCDGIDLYECAATILSENGGEGLRHPYEPVHVGVHPELKGLQRTAIERCRSNEYRSVVHYNLDILSARRSFRNGPRLAQIEVDGNHLFPVMLDKGLGRIGTTHGCIYFRCPVA